MSPLPCQKWSGFVGSWKRYAGGGGERDQETHPTFFDKGTFVHSLLKCTLPYLTSLPVDKVGNTSRHHLISKLRGGICNLTKNKGHPLTRRFDSPAVRWPGCWLVGSCLLPTSALPIHLFATSFLSSLFPPSPSHTSFVLNPPEIGLFVPFLPRVLKSSLYSKRRGLLPLSLILFSLAGLPRPFIAGSKL